MSVRKDRIEVHTFIKNLSGKTKFRVSKNSRAIGLSRQTYQNRLESLRDQKIITNFTININPDIRPNNLKFVMLEIKTNPKEPELVIELLEIPHFNNEFLMIIDPIDKNRNVASAISKKAYQYCNYQISQFLKKPDKKFFEISQVPEFNQNDFKNIKSNLYIVELKDINVKTHYTELRDKLYSFGDYITIHGEKEFTHEIKFGKIIFEIYFENELNEYNIAIFCENPIISRSNIP